jgi:hypothetical protein
MAGKVGTVRLCSHCETEGEGLRSCSACKSAWYCNVSCQRNHWPQHKQECKDFANLSDSAPIALQNKARCAQIAQLIKRLVKAIVSGPEVDWRAGGKLRNWAGLLTEIQDPKVLLCIWVGPGAKFTDVDDLHAAVMEAFNYVCDSRLYDSLLIRTRNIAAIGPPPFPLVGARVVVRLRLWAAVEDPKDPEDVLLREATGKIRTDVKLTEDSPGHQSMMHF